MAKRNKTKFVTASAATAAAPVVMPPTIAQRVPTQDEHQRMELLDNSVLMRTLDTALSMKRPHNGLGEKNMLAHVLLTCTTHAPDARWTYDADGNLHIDTRTAPHHRTLFVAHVDTVHRDDGHNHIRKTDSVWYAAGSQLGADNGAGVAIAVHLLGCGTPGRYVFTVGEEPGGIGASALARRDPALLRQFDRAITFDRRGTSSVITHQGARCCSDAFAEALCAQLCDRGLLYMPDDSGVYTDTAEFVDDIGECTNISVGYEREHSDVEALDILHFQALAIAAATIDWDSLPAVRVAGTHEANSYADAFGTWGTQLSYTAGGFMDQEDEELHDALVEWTTGSTAMLGALMVAFATEEYGTVCSEDELRPLCLRAVDALTMEDAHRFITDLTNAAPAHAVADEILSSVLS